MNAARRETLRRNAGNPEFNLVIEGLREGAGKAMKIDYPITAGEKANWTHFYYCDDGTCLTFDWNKRYEHVCSTCGKVHTGEPYDASWLTYAHYHICGGMNALGYMYAIGGNDAYAERVKSVLLDYSQHYAGYEIHGDIPYNGPGKLFSQTLDESIWIMDLCSAYSSIEDSLTPDEKRQIHEGLFRPCATFLIDYKEPQLHNHAVLITSAISILGFLLGDDDIHRAGREGQFGLLDQIGRGVLGDGFWYEGVFLYHYFALHPILNYCLHVEGTNWDLRDDPALKKMFDFPLRYILTDGSFTSLNDLSTKATIQSYTWPYEIALGWYGDDIYRQYLRIAYGIDDEHKKAFPDIDFVPGKRGSLDALLYGGDLSAGASAADSGITSSGMKLADLIYSGASSKSGGLTKLLNDKGWNLLVKHSPFGGEHDHMDRLGISFTARSVPLIIDPGTTAYGVPVHYGWLKHTYSHNTVNINGKDQPPADAIVTVYREESWGSWLESAVDWKKDEYYLKDKIVLPPEMCPWDNEAYAGAEVRRIHALTGDLLLDIVKVTVPQEREINLNYHVSGRLAHDKGWEPTDAQLSALKQQWFENKRAKRMEPVEGLEWNVQDGVLRQAGWCSLGAELFLVDTRDNPPTAYRHSLIEQVRTAGEVIFVNAFTYTGEDDASGFGLTVSATQAGSASGAAGSESKQAESAGYLLGVQIGGQSVQFRFGWSGEQVEFARIN